MPDELVNVRYMADDVEAAVDFYTNQFGFTRSRYTPGFPPPKPPGRCCGARSSASDGGRTARAARRAKAERRMSELRCAWGVSGVYPVVATSPGVTPKM